MWKLEDKARLLRGEGRNLVIVAAKPPASHRKSRFSRAHEALVGRIIKQTYTDPQMFTIRDAYRMYCYALAASGLSHERAMSYTAFRCRVRTCISSHVKHGARASSMPVTVNVRKLT